MSERDQAVEEVLSLLNQLNSDGAIGYGAYSILHDAVSEIPSRAAPPEPDDGEQQGFIDAVEGALYEVEGRHHVIGDECLCGEKKLIKNRDKTKHVARETIAALMGREVLNEISTQ